MRCALSGLRRASASAGVSRPPLQASQPTGAGQPAEKLLRQLDACAARGEVAQALVLFHVLQRHPRYARKPVLWNTMLKAYASAADFEGAEAWFERMQDAGVRVNSKAFGKLVTSAAYAGQVAKAEGWVLQAAGRTALEADLVWYGALMDACAKVGDEGRAAAWLARISAARLSGDARIFASLVESCARLGDAPSAVGWLRRMDSFGPGARSEAAHGSAIRAAARAKDAKLAVELLEEMEASGLRPGVLAHTAVVQAFVASGDPVGAGRWLQRMADSRVKPDAWTYNALISGFAKQGSESLASLWLQRMVGANLSPSVACFTSMIDCAGRRGDVEGAVAWFRKLRGSRLAPDAMAYTSVLNAFARSGDARRAERWLREMASVGCLPRDAIAYTAVIIIIIVIIIITITIIIIIIISISVTITTITITIRSSAATGGRARRPRPRGSSRRCGGGPWSRTWSPTRRSSTFTRGRVASRGRWRWLRTCRPLA